MATLGRRNRRGVWGWLLLSEDLCGEARGNWFGTQKKKGGKEALYHTEKGEEGKGEEVEAAQSKLLSESSLAKSSSSIFCWGVLRNRITKLVMEVFVASAIPSERFHLQNCEGLTRMEYAISLFLTLKSDFRLSTALTAPLQSVTGKPSNFNRDS